MAMRFLVDTNVIFELTRARPDGSALSWVGSNQKSSWVSALSVEELWFGVEMFPDGKRKTLLSRDIERLLGWYAARGKIVPFGQAEARACGEMLAAARRSGDNCSIQDVMIAATARANGMVVATRNMRDFAPLGVEAVNPFEG